MIELIKQKKKEQTRRIWKSPRVKIGGIYKVKTRIFSKEYVCKIRVTNLYKQLLNDMTPADAIAEGCTSLHEFKLLWMDIHNEWNPLLEPWVVTFKLEE